MSDKVRPIHAGVKLSDGKQQLLDTLAQACDDLAADGGDPVALVFALVAESGACRTGYHTLSLIDGKNSLHIARGVMCINVDYADWDKAYRS